jgi:hypothetical protein
MCNSNFDESQQKFNDMFRVDLELTSFSVDLEQAKGFIYIYLVAR